MAITVQEIRTYMAQDFNILIAGEAGTGKTQMVLTAAEKLNLKCKYFSVPTIDPWTDLVGIPVPQADDTVKYLRPRDIDEAEIIVFDEINRADDKTLNALLEIIQFKRINGEPLTKLKAVVAAINPNDGEYKVNELDTAMLDRFDIYMESEATVDVAYFKQRFGVEIAQAVNQFHTEYERRRLNSNRSNKNAMAYVSPRRMEKIISAFLAVPTRRTIQLSLPPKANMSPNELFDLLTKALKKKQEREARESAPVTVSVTAPATATKKNGPRRVLTGSSVDDKITQLEAMGQTFRHAPQRKIVSDLLAGSLDYTQKSRLLMTTAKHLRSDIGPENIVKKFGFALSQMEPVHLTTMMQGWTNYKRSQLHIAAKDAKIRI